MAGGRGLSILAYAGHGPVTRDGGGVAEYHVHIHLGGTREGHGWDVTAVKRGTALRIERRLLFLSLFFLDAKLEMNARTTVQRAVVQKCGYVVKLKLVAWLAGGAAAFRLRNPAFG